MAKRIHFTQQAPYNYMPLRAGLGLITDTELHNHSKRLVETAECLGNGDTYGCFELCPKIYTTRTHPLSGEYYVVEGSRFKATPVKPRIEFRVNQTWELSLKHGLIYPWHTLIAGSVWGGTNILEKNGLTFPELDLGIKNITFEQLRDELLRLNT